MITVLTCIRDEHHLGLVLLAALVCVLASGTALRFQRGLEHGTAGTRWALVVGMSLIAGGGVWATHFIAMLAYGQALAFEVEGTVVSLLIAVGGLGLGLWIGRPGAPAFRVVTGGLIVGAGIAAMHFTGIAAIRSDFALTWNAPFVIASILAAGLGGVGALIANGRLTGALGWVAPCLCLVVGIVGLHFTAMAALEVIAAVDPTHAQAGLGRTALAVTTALVALAMTAVAVAIAAFRIHGRKRAMRNMQAMFSGIPIGMAMFGPDGRLVLWNEAFATLVRLLGVTPAEGMTRRDLLTQEPATSEADPDSEVATSAKAIDDGLSREWRAPNGRWLRMEITAMPTGDSVTVVSDITQAREHAAAMARARDEAEAASRAKTEFLANMSHEIRTPLNGILGMIQVMERDELSSAQLARVKIIGDSGQALLGILNDILDLSRIEANRVELELTAVDLAALSRSVIQAFEGLAASKGLRLGLSVDETAEGFWRLDASRLRQVLANLVGNAVKFTASGEVELRLSLMGGRLGIEVRDTGIGVPLAAQGTLFEKFTQADASTTRRFGGSGLGLAICRSLVDLMEGEITLESEIGVGSRFTVHLPAVRAADLPAAAPIAPGEGSAPGFQPLRVLAAEDNETNRLVVRALLQAIDCELTLASNGLEAVAAASAEAFDLILMDVQMPEMNGVEAARIIRDEERAMGRSPVPMIALTANVMAHQIEEYRAAGMDACVAKPLSSEDLFSRMAEVLDARDRRAAA